MQGRDDVAGFIAGFAGDDRYIVDYLVEEVLQRQPEHVRSFLLQTSILDRLSGPLCDAVTGRDGGKAQLEALDRAQPVPRPARRPPPVVSLPPSLRGRAASAPAGRADPTAFLSCTAGRATGTSRTASGPRPSATRWPAGTSTVRRTWSSEASRPSPAAGRNRSCSRGCEALPDDVIPLRPVLSLHYAGALLISWGSSTARKRACEDAERWLDTTPEGLDRPTHETTGRIVVDEQEFGRLPSAIAGYRAAQAMAVGDVAGTITHAQAGLRARWS